MSRPTLTTTSHIVLGLVEFLQPATPYDLERISKLTVANFWSLPHTQLYSECANLATAGYLTEEREQEGRRRRMYRLTEAGRDALDAWRAAPSNEVEQIRDPALLKLFFGADQVLLAQAQLAAHRRRLAGYAELASQAGDAPRGGRRAALEYALAYERMSVNFWSKLAAQRARSPSRPAAAHSRHR